MSSIQVRRFARSDRDQLTALVNAHIGAVIPNLSVSVQGLMSQLEGEPGEFIVDPWVSDRLTLVAQQRSRVVAAAHLLRYQRAGFRHDGHTELVFVARVADLPRCYQPPVPGLTGRRSLGVNGTRISAILDTAAIGYIEVDTALERGARSTRFDGWADVGNLQVAEAHRRAGVGSWLVGQAADWLELGEITRLLTYADANDAATSAFLDRVGFRLLTRTQRGLTLHSR